MIRFKVGVVEQRLEGRKSELMPSNYLHIQRIIDRGAEGIDPNTLSHLCRDLECLPTDIVEFV